MKQETIYKLMHQAQVGMRMEIPAASDLYDALEALELARSRLIQIRDNALILSVTELQRLAKEGLGSE